MTVVLIRPRASVHAMLNLHGGDHAPAEYHHQVVGTYPIGDGDLDTYIKLCGNRYWGFNDPNPDFVSGYIFTWQPPAIPDDVESIKCHLRLRTHFDAQGKPVGGFFSARVNGTVTPVPVRRYDPTDWAGGHQPDDATPTWRIQWDSVPVLGEGEHSEEELQAWREYWYTVDEGGNEVPRVSTREGLRATGEVEVVGRHPDTGQPIESLAESFARTNFLEVAVDSTVTAHNEAELYDLWFTYETSEVEPPPNTGTWVLSGNVRDTGVVWL